ncbi:MAG: Gfo/Idh/MocA family oxidoreductase [Bacteroidales bacterium]|nr:Gfo/Idh/MocA family oxidoreductase [Candidatus Cryptobacteroides aphodequi]
MAIEGPVRFALFGLGNRGQRYLDWVTGHEDRATLAAVIDPDDIRLEDAHKRTGAEMFTSADKFFESGTEVDAVIVATPDKAHYPIAMEAVSRGIHVLLEKPMATTPQECRTLAEAAEKAGVVVSICFVLRYHPYYRKLYDVLHDPRMGRILSANHTVNAGLDRSIHNFVRGIWGKSEYAGPVFLSKCSHDVDLFVWLCASGIRRTASFGSRGLFSAENAPEGSAERCVDCSIEATCPFSAVNFYRRGKSVWTGYLHRHEGESLADAVERELAEGPFGRCVYHCGNDVADHQAFTMEMENGAVVNISMNFLTMENGRLTHFCCSGGEIWADGKTIRYRIFAEGDAVREIDCSDLYGQPLHSGADNAVIDNFVSTLLGEATLGGTSAAEALASHLACFAQYASDSRSVQTHASLQ